MPSPKPRIDVTARTSATRPRSTSARRPVSVVDAIASNNNALRAAGFVGVVGFGASAIDG